jgi:uncharacterized protein (DUF3820 family)
MQLGFGKYKGREIAELAEVDSKYLIWLYTCDWVNDDTKNEIAEQFDSMTLGFGRHQGETVNSVKDKDPSYYKWLTKPFVSNQFANNKPSC